MPTAQTNPDTLLDLDTIRPLTTEEQAKFNLPLPNEPQPVVLPPLRKVEKKEPITYTYTPREREMETPSNGKAHTASVPQIPRTPRKPTITKQYEPSDIPIFNRSHGILGFMEDEFPYIDIPAGRWTTTTLNGKPIPRDFIYRHLLSNPDVTVRLPYKPMRGDKSHLTIAAPIVPTTGWGIAASNIIYELAKLRLGIEIKPTQVNESDESDNEPLWQTAYDYSELAKQSDLMLFPLANWHHTEQPDLVRALMTKPHYPTEWALALTIPSDLPPIPSPNTVLFSMWETGVLPSEWRSLMEQNNVRHLIVPSQAQVELFRQGYDGEIDVVPLGVDPNVWQFCERPKRGEDEPFTILLYGLLSARKCPIETVVEVCYRAFSGAYGEPVDNWRIILKTRQNVLAGGRINDVHVEVINGDYTPQLLWELTHQADVGIFLSRFEGFGLPAREAMASGLPVILSDNSGHSDISDSRYNIPIPTAEIIEAKEMYRNEQENWWWAEPNFELAARALRKEYDEWTTRGRVQSEMGRRASKMIHENYTWKQTAQGIQNVLERVIPRT